MAKYKPVKNGPSRPQEMRGMPFFIDSFLYWALKSAFQLPLFIGFYYFSVGLWKRNGAIIPLWKELFYIFLLLILSDFLAHLIASMLDDYIIHHWGYLRNPKNHKLKMLVITQYLFYVLYRTLSYGFGFIWYLTAWLYPYCKGWSFLVAWFIISLGARLLAFVSASVFFTRF